MTLIRRNAVNPFISNLFDDFFANTEMAKPRRNPLAVPPVNIFADEKNYRIELVAPGLQKEDFEITLDENVITISAQKEEENTSETENCTRKEFASVAFSRAFTLPENADAEKIVAKSVDGILTILIEKKKEEPKISKTIQIN